MIEVTKSPNADSRTATPGTSTDELMRSTELHIGDVSKGLNFFAELLIKAGSQHDHTKTDSIDEFSAALSSGHVKETKWYKRHITEERHHLKSNVPDDVNLIDVIEHLVDCTMAGLTRSGTIYDVDIFPEVLQLAAQNTVELLKKNVKVVEATTDVGDEPIDQ